MSRPALAALKENRRLLVTASFLSGALGLIPVPLVGDLGIDLLRAGLLRHLARRRGTSLTRHTALILIGADRTSVGRLALSAGVVLGARLLWKRLTRTLLVLLRFDDMGRTFTLGTVFDYYCITRRPGEELSVEQAEAVHRALVVAAREARPQLAAAIFRRAVGELVTAGTSVPRALWRLLGDLLGDERRGGGREGSPPSGRDQQDERRGGGREGEGSGERAVEEVVEQDLEGFFARLTHLVERELATAEETVLEALCASFDAAWAAESKAASGGASDGAAGTATSSGTETGGGGAETSGGGAETSGGAAGGAGAGSSTGAGGEGGGETTGG